MYLLLFIVTTANRWTSRFYYNLEIMYIPIYRVLYSWNGMKLLTKNINMQKYLWTDNWCSTCWFYRGNNLQVSIRCSSFVLRWTLSSNNVKRGETGWNEMIIDSHRSKSQNSNPVNWFNYLSRHSTAWLGGKSHTLQIRSHYSFVYTRATSNRCSIINLVIPFFQIKPPAETVNVETV